MTTTAHPALWPSRCPGCEKPGCLGTCHQCELAEAWERSFDALVELGASMVKRPPRFPRLHHWLIHLAMLRTSCFECDLRARDAKTRQIEEADPGIVEMRRIAAYRRSQHAEAN